MSKPEFKRKKVERNQEEQPKRSDRKTTGMENQEDHRFYTFRVGNINKSNATLVDSDYNIIEFPVYMLPCNSKPGSVIQMQIRKDDQEEERRENEVDKICNKVINGIHGNQTNKILSDE